MCGILACISTMDITKIKDGFDLISHRGPDDSDFCVIDTYATSPDQKKNVVFGFHRLSIMDISHGMQPFVVDEVYLICNGEIFNHQELEQKYDIQTKSKSDCEVIAHLYIKLGRNEQAARELCKLLDAEFAFVLYDKRNRVTVAARDPFGIRPLFISYTEYSNVYMASELKALSFCQEVFQFTPGTVMYRKYVRDTNEYNAISFVNYHDIMDGNWYKSKYKNQDTYETACSKISTLLEDAVEKRLMSDRPIGCFLSGGVDSSLVTALVAKLHKGPLQCFSIGLIGSPDIEAANLVVKHIKTYINPDIQHHVVHFTIEEGIKAIEEVIWHLETYDITTIRASVPQYLLAKYIRANTDIATMFSGEGADELFASYLYFRKAPSPKKMQEESAYLLHKLHYYDNLRVDRTNAAHGLEVRIPFLDRALVDYVFQCNPEYRSCTDKIEKKLLRDSFQSMNLLPHNILYRKKEAFSDAVSSKDQNWYQSVQEFAKTKVNMEGRRFGYNSPPNEEALYYRMIFCRQYKYRYDILPKFWMPRWQDTNGDPSATALDCYE